MKKNINILNISENWTHFWAGSLDTHNLTNPDYVRRHPSIIDHEMEDVDAAEYAAMRMSIIKKHGCTVNGHYISGKNAKQCLEALKEMRAELAIKSLNDKDIFTKAQVNQIFNAVMMQATKLSKKYKCPFRGFRFAINGGRSVNQSSASICTLGFLMKKKEESFTEMIKRCVKQFAFYIFCYSPDSRIQKWKKCGEKTWKSFEKWWPTEAAAMNDCCSPLKMFGA